MWSNSWFPCLSTHEGPRYHLIEDESPYTNDEGFVDFGPGDVENPQNWSTRRKWFITACAIVPVLNGNFASSVPSGCLDSIMEEFDVSQQAASLTVVLFLLGYCAGPFAFAPLSEFYGRQNMFYISFALFMAFNVSCAFPPNFECLLISRLLAGTTISAALCNTPALLADIWQPIERGNPMAGFSMAVWIGPGLGPIVGGFAELRKDWRWGFYAVLLLGALSVPPVLALPETNQSTILKRRAVRIRQAEIAGYEDVMAPSEADDRSLFDIYKVALIRPWILLVDPISLLCAIYMGVVFTLQFMLFSIYPIVFQQMRGWNAGISQLPLLGTILGSVFGAWIIILDTRRRWRKFDHGDALQPEDRLLLAMIGGIGFPVAMFWFAWTGNYSSVHWVVPTLAGAFLSTSLMLIYFAYLNYIVDAYVQYSASAVAANTFARSIGSAAAPLFTDSMFKELGVGGGGSLIGGIAVLLAVIPFAFYKYGMQIRIRSKYVPTEESASTAKLNTATPIHFIFAGSEDN